MSTIQEILSRNNISKVDNTDVNAISIGEKIAAVLDYFQDNKIDTDFIESIGEEHARMGRLTKGQITAVNNIIKGYKIVL